MLANGRSFTGTHKPRQVPHPLPVTHPLKVPCPKWDKYHLAIMCALLTEGLSALRCSAQEPWRDDRTVTGGSKALGTVAGPDRLRRLRALAFPIFRQHEGVYLLSRFVSSRRLQDQPGQPVLRMATVKSFDLNGLGLNALLSARTVAILCGIWLAYRVAIALYNISPLHPLYRFPGPNWPRWDSSTKGITTGSSLAGMVMRSDGCTRNTVLC